MKIILGLELLFRLHQSVVTTLKPRSGNEYQKVDRISFLDGESKVSWLKENNVELNECTKYRFKIHIEI